MAWKAALIGGKLINHIPTKLLPVKGAHGGNDCAAYGPGFAKLAGTDTCVKVGGAVSVEVGGSR